PTDEADPHPERRWSAPPSVPRAAVGHRTVLAAGAQALPGHRYPCRQASGRGPNTAILPTDLQPVRSRVDRPDQVAPVQGDDLVGADEDDPALIALLIGEDRQVLTLRDSARQGAVRPGGRQLGLPPRRAGGRGDGGAGVTQ